MSRVREGLMVLLGTVVLMGCATSTPGEPGQQSPQPARRVVKNGVAVELSVVPIHARSSPPELMQGDDVSVRLRITDVDSGDPLSGLDPLGWIDQHTAPGGESLCRQKIQSFLNTTLSARPEIDLNTYYVLTLNRDNTIAVIDPLFSFGGSKLLTVVFLDNPAADWVLMPDQDRLFVSIPLLNEIEVVDTASWKMASRIAVGRAPRRLRLQPDSAYLWASIDEASRSSGGVSVIDSAAGREVARIETGNGAHEIVFTADSRYAFVTNSEDGTLSIIDVRELREMRRLSTAKDPVTLAYSPLANAVYVGHSDGEIVIFDAVRHEVRDRIKAGTAVNFLRFSPDGRWAFSLDTANDRLRVIDSSTNRVVQTIPVGPRPDQVAFTNTFAYVRCSGSSDVALIRLSSVAEGREPDLARFPGGQIAPEYASGSYLPDPIVAAPEQNAVLLSNPGDKLVYYYSEGMAAPMGSFRTYGREPMGVLVVDRSLREVEPGQYATAVKLQSPGEFDVPFLLSSVGIGECFRISVATNPSLERGGQTAVKIEPLFDSTRARAGAPFPVRFRVTNQATGQPVTGLKDLRVLAFTPGNAQRRKPAHALEDGVYEASVVPPAAGIYFVFVECPSLRLAYRDSPRWIVQVTAVETSPAVSVSDQP